MSRPSVGLALIAAMAGFAALVFPSLPARIAVHWNWAGEVDGWMNRFPAAFLVPALALVLWALLRWLPRLDPRVAHYESFWDTYHLLVNLIIFFLALVHALVLGYALGWAVDVTSVVLALVGILFVVLGHYLPRVRSNWWLGVRTPWTLESERVWAETHRLAGRTFVAGGIVTVAAALLPHPLRPWVALAGLLLGGLTPAVYSYFSWRREHRAA